MSEPYAEVFDDDGNPIELPAEAVAWRVRRVPSSRGGRPVVIFRGGRPLELELDAPVEDDLRRLIGAGRYRLDPVDESGRLIAEAPCAVVEVSKAPRSTSDELALVLELAREHAETAREFSRQLAAITGGTAQLLEAADGAGLTARHAPRVARADSDTSQAPAPAAAPSGLAQLAEQWMPMLAHMAARLGLVPQAAIPAAPAAPAAAQMAAPSAAIDDAAAPAPSTVPSAPPAATSAPQSGAIASMAATGQGEVNARPSGAAGRAPGRGNLLERGVAIEALLTPHERTYVRQIAAQMHAGELASWHELILTREPRQVVAYLRQQMATQAAAGRQP